MLARLFRRAIRQNLLRQLPVVVRGAAAGIVLEDAGALDRSLGEFDRLADPGLEDKVAEVLFETSNPEVVIEGILHDVDARTVHAKEAVRVLEENFGDLVFKSRIRKAVKFATRLRSRAPASSSTIPAAAPRTTTGSWRRRFWRMARRQ